MLIKLYTGRNLHSRSTKSYSGTWKWQYSKKKDAKYILWTFKNKTKNQITFTRVGLLASDNKTSMKERKINLYLKPFGVTTATMYVGDLNLDVSGNTVTYCIYGQPKKNLLNLSIKNHLLKKNTHTRNRKNTMIISLCSTYFYY